MSEDGGTTRALLIPVVPAAECGGHGDDGEGEGGARDSPDLRRERPSSLAPYGVLTNTCSMEEEISSCRSAVRPAKTLRRRRRKKQRTVKEDFLTFSFCKLFVYRCMVRRAKKHQVGRQPGLVFFGFFLD